MKNSLNYRHSSSNRQIATRLLSDIIVAGVVLLIASCIKISYIRGSWAAFFSATSCVIPAAGLVAGPYGSLCISVVRILQMIITAPFRLPTLLLNVVPGAVASAYWYAPRWLMNLIIPLLSIVLFVFHPVGAQAYLYSLLWIIPMCVGCIPQVPLFVRALSSSLIAHAVGSVLWLYLLPSTPALWLGILPVVIIERVVMALGIVLAYYLYAGGVKLYSSFFVDESVE